MMYLPEIELFRVNAISKLVNAFGDTIPYVDRLEISVSAIELMVEMMKGLKK